ncbi:MAG: trypsin-like serine peptidase [Bacteriovoracaceae bacterium]
MVFIIFILIGCRQQKLVESTFISSNVIVDELNWYEINNKFPNQVIEQAKSVVTVESGELRCTGLFITSEIVLTAAHCLGDTNRIVLSDKKLFCDEVLYKSSSYDFGLLKCQRPKAIYIKPYDLHEFVSPTKNEKVYLIHNNCSAFESQCIVKTRISPGRIIDIDKVIKHTSDTFKGSSGAPLFSAEDFKLVGFHIKGNQESPYYGPYNIALPVQNIIDDLSANFFIP